MIADELRLAQQHVDRALGRMGKIAGTGHSYVGSLRDYKRLVSLSLRLRHLAQAIERGEALVIARNTRRMADVAGPGKDEEC